MTKWVSVSLALAFLGMFSFGCAGVSKDTKVRCPKCGAIFTINEGLDEMHAGGGA